MKTLEDITTSLKLAKELKEVGFPQKESLFYWVKKVSALDYGNALKEKGKWVDDPRGGKSLVCKPKDLDNYGTWKLLAMDDKNCEDSGWGYYSAPTAEEILKVLRNKIPEKVTIPTISERMRKLGNRLFSEYWFLNKDLTNDLAEMVIYLAKNKIIKFER